MSLTTLDALKKIYTGPGWFDPWARELRVSCLSLAEQDGLLASIAAEFDGRRRRPRPPLLMGRLHRYVELRTRKALTR